ncbi:hypothetical protein BU24DRAFT_118098 [Aaosphaeria arxii CBS 175.79]|uniref:Uncharacterized protein n=1 Tax=Aaosphaeria arxii CBS 175.79 TaxID=1450172 RepID=A0A6A5Y282_9PLEO|nr:uncharacterized protein BU24DRAFT_118098 [Aaosphaeria arxii CBS 175.79]KAF2019349.1 hypothetical protein BU24DRAFT_118098 [Aaosphaeria arxii CBS 175.79]
MSGRARYCLPVCVCACVRVCARVCVRRARRPDERGKVTWAVLLITVWPGCILVYKTQPSLLATLVTPSYPHLRPTPNIQHSKPLSTEQHSIQLPISALRVQPQLERGSSAYFQSNYPYALTLQVLRNTSGRGQEFTQDLPCIRCAVYHLVKTQD